MCFPLNQVDLKINEKEVIEEIPDLEKAYSVKVLDENIIMPVEHGLGVIWDTNPDCCVYEVMRRKATLVARF